MKFVGWILGGLLALAVLRMAAIVTFGAIILALVVALIRAPKETLAILTSLSFLSAFAAYPLVGLLVCALILTLSISSRP
ncbi:hypothetical protein [Tsuneonella troitsensis]|uniref:hypothetical protein n=1 Tax=Tsuneonella troitsensis TaxID=292222 RepID=UPI00070F28DE|nr:hypothetical protein [Tsuneonella troitsensis]